jgi:nicotinamide-nucleotide amidase
MLKIAILTIGDEICIGQVVNTNAVWIAQQCVKLGCEVSLHSTIGDEKEIMLSEIDRLFGSADFIITTGGLGPTHDDITKPVLCEYFDDEQILDQRTLDNIEEMFALRGIKVTERNRIQAMVPSKCNVLSNKLGTAPGLMFERDGKYIVSLPGVPKEMKHIMETGVLPLIATLIRENKYDVVAYKNLLTTGIPESYLADLIGDPMEFLEGGSLAFLPSYSGVRLRIGASAGSFEMANGKIGKIENVIRSRAGKYIYGVDEDSLTKIIGEILKSRKETLAVAESCTGGMIGAEMTSLSGSSQYFLGGAIVYSNEAKIETLGVSKETILEHGAVSRETAIEMAMNARQKFGSDYSISVTGIAGPEGGTKEKPVGTVWIGISDRNRTFAEKFYLGADRQVVRERTVATALRLLYDLLLEKQGTK